MQMGWTRSGRVLRELVGSCIDGACALPTGARPASVVMALLALLVASVFVAAEICGAVLLWARRGSRAYEMSQLLFPNQLTSSDSVLWSRRRLRSNLRALVGILACCATGVGALLVKMATNRDHLRIQATSAAVELERMPTLASCASLALREEARAAVVGVASLLLVLVLLPVILAVRPSACRAQPSATLESMLRQKDERIRELEAAIAAMLAISEDR